MISKHSAVLLMAGNTRPPNRHVVAITIARNFINFGNRQSGADQHRIPLPAVTIMATCCLLVRPLRLLFMSVNRKNDIIGPQSHECRK